MSVYLKLMKVQNELKAPKSQFNKFGNYNYRNCEDILEAVKPILIENKSLIIISDEVEFVEGRYYVRASAVFIDAETGEKIETFASAREVNEKKGMDGSQITGSSSSYARKYALNGLLLIDDTKDADYKNNKDDLKNKNEKKLSDAQIKRLYAIANNVDKSEEDIKKWIKVKWNKDSSNDLTKKEYDEICNALQKK